MYSIFTFQLSEDSHTFMLHIKKVAEEDFQTYKLKLINDVGEVEESIILEKGICCSKKILMVLNNVTLLELNVSIFGS